MTRLLVTLSALTLIVAGCAREPERVDSAAMSCMAEAIYFEARGTGVEGMRAVGEVILNRVDDPRFPGSVCGVIADQCQFTYRCDDIPDDQFNEPAQYALARNISTALLLERQQDITNGALFFHSARMSPGGWFGSLDQAGQFGGNVFYR